MPRRVLATLILGSAALGTVGLGIFAARPRHEPAVRATLSVADALGGRTIGFERAAAPRRFSFPDDHGPHPGFRTEWWYFTGNLEAADGRRFGYQLTFFRNALTPESVARSSGWGANEVFMAHFAVTDVDGGAFHAFDRFARAAVDLAGARGRPLRVWVEDWTASTDDGPDDFPLRLRAEQEGVSIALSLEAGKPPVLQGIDGLSRKGPEPGNASYYYSLTRMPTRGTIRLDDQTFAVDGTSWMDREWSTSALGEDQVGWDWFALRLSDGSDIIFYQIRRSDGTKDPFSAGSVIGADGARAPLTADVVEIHVLDHWTSPHSGTRYPSRWRIRIPSRATDLEVVPEIADQELNLAVRYWEGAVRFTGSHDGRSVDGAGYVELTGYGDVARSRPGLRDR